MLDQILETAEKYCMISEGDHISVALSGGADSVCLLLALDELREKLGITLTALHVNHSIRGRESDRDEEFCRTLCGKLGIPFVCGRFDVPAEAVKMKMSTELAAREIRYRFFAEHMEDGKLATAHNANDNAETVIFNLTRGTGTKGISGIPPVRDNIIRPLIGVTRSEIEAYLKEKGQDYVTDSTNLSDDYTRNTIRHNVIPVLEKINSSLFKTILSDSDNFRTDNSFIEEETEKAFAACLRGCNTLEGLADLHPAVRRRCISKLLEKSGVEVNSRRIADIEKIVLCGGKINLRGELYAVSDKKRLATKRIPGRTASSEPICIPLREGIHEFRGKTVIVSMSDISKLTEKNDLPSGTACIDADCLKGQAVIRSRLPGDRIRLAGRNFTSSVKKLLNSSTKLSERDSICFVADEEGPVFIEGTGTADRVKINNSTKNLLLIRVVCEETMKI